MARPRPLPGSRLVQPRTARQHRVALRRRDARAVVVHRDHQLFRRHGPRRSRTALRAHCRRCPAGCPASPAGPVLRRQRPVGGSMGVSVKRRSRARRARAPSHAAVPRARGHRCALAGQAGCEAATRARLRWAVDVAPGHRHLLLHQRGQIGAAPPTLGGLRQHRQRCLQRMGQVARLGAGARHHLGVGGPAPG